MISSLISSLFKPAADLIDNLHTSDDERAAARQKMAAIEATLISQVITAQAHNIQAEANGKSWLQRNWRPITMLTFLILIVCDAFGWLAFRLSIEAWALLKIGLGGYVVGRTVEKITPAVAGLVKK